MKMSRFLCIALFFFAVPFLSAQPDRWQQAIQYDMDIDFDAENHHFTGKQTIKYTNNSPDELNMVFYHLYYNAFQPNSMMDVRSRTIKDPDPRVGGRIQALQPSEIGYHKVKSLKQNGSDVSYHVEGTILEVKLNQPIKPGGSATFDMEFESQVPLQIRRTGRNSKEGIDYSMSQWYPKLCEYDYQGWHANPYVGREFHGVWGDFRVNITMDKKYVMAASGYLQNAKEIGHGFGGLPEGPVAGAPDRITWKWYAPNVHDFAWGADPDYTHTTYKVHDDLTLHFLYQKNEKTEDEWARLPKIMAESYTFLKAKYGEYPYKQYTFIQGGDGGMEYPMLTLITGERNLASLVGVSVHEWVHSWYQMMLGTNEALYAWMDEGFTSYASAEIMNYLRQEGALPGAAVDNPHAGSYVGYKNLAESGVEEPMTTHADHFDTNFAYGVASYVKGAVFLHQLEYIIGEKNFDQGMLDYYNAWRFKHPNDNDFIRIMEKRSGLELDWYREYWVQTTKTIDYGVQSVEADGKKTVVKLKKEGLMPMPLDVVVTEKNGKVTTYHIPLRVMRGAKENEGGTDWEVLDDWPWTHPEYEFTIDCKLKKIVSVQIDPSKRMADLDQSDNNWSQED